MLTGLKKYFSHCIIAVIALQVLNLGLYAQDFNTAPMVNGVEQNIINSVTEYIAEVVLNKVNAFPEKKESSNQNGSHELLFKLQPFKILIHSLPDGAELIVKAIASYNIFSLPSYSDYCNDIPLPPPKI